MKKITFNILVSMCLICFLIMLIVSIVLFSLREYLIIYALTHVLLPIPEFDHTPLAIIGIIASSIGISISIFILIRINKTELLVAAETTKERVKEYRAERKAAKKEKKKAALQAKLNKLEK